MRSKHLMTRFFIFIFLFTFCIIGIFPSDTVGDSILPEEKLTYRIRVFYDHTKDAIQLDASSSLLGMPVIIAYGECLQRFQQSKYHADVVPFASGMLLGKYPVGNLQQSSIVDYSGKKGKIEFLESGTIDICVPYFKRGKSVEIYNSGNNQLVLSVDVLRYAGKYFIRDPETLNLIPASEMEVEQIQKTEGELKREEFIPSFTKSKPLASSTSFLLRNWWKILIAVIIVCIIIFIYREVKKSKLPPPH